MANRRGKVQSLSCVQLFVTSWTAEEEKVEVMTDFLFLGSKITPDGDHSLEIPRYLLLSRKNMINLDRVLKSRDITSANKGPYSQSYDLPCGHVRLWEWDCKEGRMPKNWCLWTVVLKKTPESPLDSREIKRVNLKGNQPRIFTGRTDAAPEAPAFSSPDGMSRLIETDPDAGKDLRQKKREQWRMRWLDTVTYSMDMKLSQLQETVADRGPWHTVVHGITKSWTRLSNWTTPPPEFWDWPLSIKR